MRWICSFFAVLLFSALLNGCVTAPRIDWNKRVGTYTYDQSVRELGVPDKYQKLSDNSIVAEWALQHYTPDYALYGGGGYWDHPFAFGYGYPVSSAYTRWLRLIFAPDGRLQSFLKYDR
jgi:hypothetical protein